MNRLSKFGLQNLILVAGVALVACQQTPPSASLSLQLAAVGTNYYLDCSATSNGTGTQASPWNTLTTVNATTFAAGSSVLIKRGTSCSGMLSPQGSGNASSINTIGAYGTGANPIIAGGSNQAAIKLYNQQHWRIENLETSGGNPYGVFISGNQAAIFERIQLINLTVHDVGGTATQKETGLVVVTGQSKDTAFNNVLIDGVTAYNTQQWSGIMVGGDNYESLGFTGSVANTNVTIQNSTVYNTYGDGIVLFHVTNGLIQNSIAHDVGKIPTTGVGTPNGIWTWWCNTCTVQYNEVYNVASPGYDGGAFDIDYWNDNNIVQYNYGHDNQGYCVAVLGAGGRATTNSIVRYNVCANNGRRAGWGWGLGSQQGDVWFNTWAGGSVDGVQVYNNTFYWNPASNEPVLVNKGANLSGTNPRFFRNNIVISTVDKLIWSDNTLSFNNNLYWFTGSTAPYWGYNGGWWTSLSSYAAGSGQDSQSLYANPNLNSLGYHAVGRPVAQYTLLSNSLAINAGVDLGNTGNKDFFGNTAPRSSGYDLGANESIFGNLIRNPSFETTTNWNHWWDSVVNLSSVAFYSSAGGHSGTKRLSHWSALGAYKQYTYQTLAGLPSGTYTLKTWLQTSGGLGKISFGAKNCNGSGIQELSLPTAFNGAWVQYSTQITVSSNSSSCEFFVWSESLGGATRWANFDDLELVKN
jgi:hypothetical protein